MIEIGVYDNQHRFQTILVMLRPEELTPEACEYYVGAALLEAYLTGVDITNATMQARRIIVIDPAMN